MREVHLIIGLPGSGKTTLAKKLHETHGGVLFDDVNNIENRDQVFAETTADTIIMTDPHLCMANPTAIMDTLMGWFGDDVYVVAYLFKPDVAQSLENIKARNDGRFISKYTIDKMNEGYNVTWMNQGLAFYGSSTIVETYRP